MASIEITSSERFGGSLSVPERGGLPAADQKTRDAVLQQMEHLIEVKEGLTQKALSSWIRRWSPPLILGDIFTISYLVFQGVQMVIPGAAASMALPNLICGVAGGGINLGVGLYCLYESLWEFYQGDKEKGARLFSDFVALTALGSVMILGSVGSASVRAFITANPWLMMTSFMWLTIPLVVELGVGKVRSNKLEEELQLDVLEALLADAETTRLALQYFVGDYPFYQKPEKENVGEILEGLQQTVQVRAALELFKLSKMVYAAHISEEAFNKTEILKQVQTSKEALAKWNRALKLRGFQQLVYILGFGANMAALQARGVAADRWNSATLFSSAIANFIALFMDANPDPEWRFNGNTPLVVAPATKDGRCVCASCAAYMPEPFSP